MISEAHGDVMTRPSKKVVSALALPVLNRTRLAIESDLERQSHHRLIEETRRVRQSSAETRALAVRMRQSSAETRTRSARETDRLAQLLRDRASLLSRKPRGRQAVGDGIRIAQLRQMLKLEREMIVDIQCMADDARRCVEATRALCDVAHERCRASREALLPLPAALK